jgi:DNA-binding MarR family transcriptional regulator
MLRRDEGSANVGAVNARFREIESDLGPVVEFMRQLWAVEQGLDVVSRRMESRLGITGRQRLMVLILGRTGEISAGELARILHLNPSTVTFNLQQLEDHGVVLRTNDRYDARRALVSLTARGRTIYARKKGTVEAAVRRVLAGLPHQVSAAQSVLARLAAELQRGD